MTMPKRLAPLLPAEEGAPKLTFDSLRDDSSKRKRVGTEIACNPCRKRKTRCDGRRPACQACLKRSSECIYVEKKEFSKTAQSAEVLQEVVDIMRAVPEQHALRIFRLLRSTDDLTSVLSFAKTEMNGAVGPSGRASTSSSRTAQSSLELELMVKNPTAYPAPRTPLTASERVGLLAPNKLRRSKSLDHQYVCPVTVPLFPFLLDATDLLNGSRSDVWSGLTSRLPTGDRILLSPVDGLLHLGKDDSPANDYPDGNPGTNPELCDSRLQHLDIGFWTSVRITDEYAKRVISLYIITDHPLLGIFDANLFISDLVNKEHTYCSRLLVNSLLYWGCQMYTAIDDEASELADLFCEEAERLWFQENCNDTLLNVASSQLLSLAYLGHGKDHYVLKYLSTAMRMATRMCLLGVEPSQAMPKINDMSPDMRRASSYTAWGIFNWGVLITLFYQQPGLEYPSHPPTFPIPDNPNPQQSDHESSSLGSETPEQSSPSYMGQTFPTLCRFWRILHGVSLHYHKDRDTPLPDHVSLDFAEFKYRELLAWIENLPSDQVLRDKSPHHVVVFHIWFHAAILDIFRPFLQRSGHERQRLKTFSARRSYPEAAFQASVNQLKELVLRYRCNYESSAYTLLWQTALIYVANAVLHETQDSDWRFYFLACIYGYEGLRKSYRVAEVISKGLLTMTLRGGNISSDEARNLMKQVHDADGSHTADDVRATFMIDLDLAMTDPEAAKVENLAQRFEDISLFRDFTNVDDQETGNFRRRDSSSSTP